MLGRRSPEGLDICAGDAVTDRSMVGREPPDCVAMEDGFLRRTFRDDFPLSSRLFPDPVLGLSIDFPNPKLPPKPLGLVSGTDDEIGNGSLALGLGSGSRRILCIGDCPRRGLSWPDR